MLVLSRRDGESITIAGLVKVSVHKITRRRVSLSVHAPRDMSVKRSELADIDGIDVKQISREFLLLLTAQCKVQRDVTKHIDEIVGSIDSLMKGAA